MKVKLEQKCLYNRHRHGFWPLVTVVSRHFVFTEFTDASMPPDNAGMSTHRLSPYKAYYLY